MLSVQTNTTALSVQRFLNKSAQAQSSNQGKASSGSAIVRAADDAAGLAISNKMRADIASLRQGQKNASQGASLLQIANGATDRAVDILTRLKELASNNDLLGAAEKKFKQAEVNQLLDQLNAIATQTTVTGRAIMNGVDKALKGPQTAAITNTTGFSANGVFSVNANGITGIAGNIVGTVTDARVNLSGTNVVAEIDIDGRTFRALPVAHTDADGAQTLNFIDITNAQNRFTFTTGTGGTTAATVAASQNGLRTSLGVGSALPTKFSEQALATTVASGLLAGSTLDAANSGIDFTVGSFLGGVNGTYKKASVVEVGSSFVVSLDIGNETYKGSIAVGATTGGFQLTSTTNDNNKFTLTLVASNSAPATGAAATLITALDTLFKKSATDGSTVSFTGGAAAESAGAALLKAGAATYADVVRTSSATKADTYTLTTKFVAGSTVNGTAEKVVFRLQGSDGSVSEAEIKDESGTVVDNTIIDPSVTKARTLQFGNGITLNLDTASINNMVSTPIGSSDAKSIKFTVGDGEATILKFQTGIASTDVLAVGLDPLNVKSLGLTGISMEDNAKATDAVDRVDAALARVNLLSANIGAQQSRLDFTMDVNATTLENYQAANSVVRDADLSAVLTDLSQATLRNNVATAILSQANQTPTQTVSRLLQGL